LNRESSKILEKYCLPTTEAYNLVDLASFKQQIQDGMLFYLRYSSESKQQYGFSNSVLDILALCRDLDMYLDHLDKGFIVSVERKYNTLIGGATLYADKFIYTEIVKGHSITLLRRGLCGARIVLHKQGGITIRREFQRFYAQQQTNYIYLPSGGPSDSEIQDVTSKIAKYINTGEPGLLIEWMITEESGFLCCDAKTGFSQFGAELSDLSNSDTITVFDSVNEKNRGLRLSIGDFDCDLANQLCDGNCLLIANSEALLSHLVTSAFLLGNCRCILHKTC
jgi:hypothetical protein